MGISGVIRRVAILALPMLEMGTLTKKEMCENPRSYWVIRMTAGTLPEIRNRVRGKFENVVRNWAIFARGAQYALWGQKAPRRPIAPRGQKSTRLDRHFQVLLVFGGVFRVRWSHPFNRPVVRRYFAPHRFVKVPCSILEYCSLKSLSMSQRY